MFVFPLNAASDVVRSNVDMQLSIFLALSRSMIDTSSSLGRLNMQSGIKMLEEVSGVFSDAIRINATAATQSVTAEGSQDGGTAAQPRQQHSRNALSAPAGNGNQSTGDEGTKQASSIADHDGKAPKHAGSSHEHETDPRPSPLLEKLVATVAVEPDQLEK